MKRVDFSNIDIAKGNPSKNISAWREEKQNQDGWNTPEQIALRHVYGRDDIADDLHPGFGSGCKSSAISSRP